MRVSSPVLVLGIVAGLLLQPATRARAAWPHDPGANVPITTALGSQRLVDSFSDGFGGAVVVWIDGYLDTSEVIVAQRVDAKGVPLWGPDGVRVVTHVGEVAVSPDGSGGVIVAWTDGRNTYPSIYAQRVSAAGVPLWATGGVLLCTETGGRQTPVAVSDGSGGAIVAWMDTRSGLDLDIYARRVDAAGVPLWTPNGVPVCTATDRQVFPSTARTITTDGSGGAIITWEDYRTHGGDDVYAQRVSAAGTPLWTANGVAVCTLPSNQFQANIASDGLGGAIIAWVSTSNGDLRAQRLNASGVAQWVTDGVPLNAGVGSGGQMAVPDGFGGAIFAFYGGKTIVAQRVTAAGALPWGANGVPICTVGKVEGNAPVGVVSDGSGGAIVAWPDTLNGVDADMYVQRVSASGRVQWRQNGWPVCTAAGDQWSPIVASDGTGGAIVAWQDSRNGPSAYNDIYAQRVDEFGTLGSEPTITSVSDVRADQGGHVRIRWNASYRDTLPGLGISLYGVWRQVTESAATAAIRNGASVVEPASATRAATGVFRLDRVTDTWWEGVGTVAARGDPWYTFVAETFQDSTAQANPYTTFMVDAHGQVEGPAFGFVPAFFESAPDSGYSVDNLPPATPAPFTGRFASGTVSLHWARNAEPDFAAYRLHRGSSAGFVPGSDNLVAQQPDTGYVGAAPGVFHYKLAAMDVHGNLSGYALLSPADIAGVGGAPGPVELSLSLGSANPSSGGALLRWALPTEGEVRLAVYDVAGRMVRELLTGRQAAGEHETVWDGRDASGAPAGTGLYLARLQASGRTLSLRVTQLR